MSDYACSEAKKESISARAGGASSEGPEATHLIGKNVSRKRLLASAMPKSTPVRKVHDIL
jgi:hypothetical protein